MAQSLENNKFSILEIDFRTFCSLRFKPPLTSMIGITFVIVTAHSQTQSESEKCKPEKQVIADAGYEVDLHSSFLPAAKRHGHAEA